MAANRARISEQEPWQDAILVVDVLAGHLTGFSSELKGILADGTMGFHHDVAVSDLDGGHRFDGGLRSRWVFEATAPTESIDLDLGELVE